MVHFVERVRDGVRTYKDPALTHQRLTPVEVEEVAEEHVADEHRVHYRVDVVRPEIRDTYQDHVRLPFDGDDLLPVDVPQRLFMHWVGGASLHARHLVWSLDTLEDPARDPAWHGLRHLVVR